MTGCGERMNAAGGVLHGPVATKALDPGPRDVILIANDDTPFEAVGPALIESRMLNLSVANNRRIGERICGMVLMRGYLRSPCPNVNDAGRDVV